MKTAFSYLEGPGGALAGDYGEILADSVKFEFVLDNKTGSGDYKISDIRLYDKAGNQGFYNSNYLKDRNFIYSTNLVNQDADNSAPEIKKLSLIQGNENNSKYITVNVESNEQDSALKYIYIRMSSENYTIDRYIEKRISNSPINRTEKILVPSQYSNDNFIISYIFLTDKALNKKNYSKSDLQSLGFPTTIKLSPTVN